MKVTIYTINDCKFSQAERDYLKTNNIAFEEKNVEQNRDFLTEMLGISENFAGTPVTKIEKDDGSTNVLKGFTQEEFDKELGLATAAVAPMASAPTDNTAAPTAPPATPSVGGAPDVIPPMPPTPPKEMNVPAQEPEPTPVNADPISLSDSPTTAPVDSQTMPISLSENPVAPKPVDAMPPYIPNEKVAEPVVQSAAPDATAAPSTPPAGSANSPQEPPADQLNSVLENLQNQVNTVVPAEPAKPPIDPNAPTSPAGGPAPVTKV